MKIMITNKESELIASITSKDNVEFEVSKHKDYNITIDGNKIDLEKEPNSCEKGEFGRLILTMIKNCLDVNYIGTMKNELKELESNIGDLEKFLEKEEIEQKFTNSEQRKRIIKQLNYMYGYRDMLEYRIKNDKTVEDVQEHNRFMEKLTKNIDSTKQ